MRELDIAVRDCMTSPVVGVRDDALLEEVERVLRRREISGVAVVDRSGAAVGVITRTDLLRAGRTRRDEAGGEHVLTLPDTPVHKHMHAGIVTIGPQATLADAARHMVEHHVHRIYVTAGSELVGVVSTREVLRAIAAARSSKPIADLMSIALVTVRPEDPLEFAIDRLTAANVSGLVVVDREWPIGVFGQLEALEAREADPGERVDFWMDALVICVPMWLPAHRAAAQALATNCRRVLAVDDMRARGLVTGIDFARIASVTPRRLG